MRSNTGLDFGLGETADLLRDSVRGFAADRIAPRADEIDRSNTFPRDLWPELGALGVHGITVEEEWGGAGLGYLEHCVAMEEISRASGVGRAVLRRAFQSLHQPDPPQRQRRAEAPLSAEADFRRACRRAGDVGAECRLRRGLDDARAPRRKGDRYVLNGSKMWITNGPHADDAGGLCQDRSCRRRAWHHRFHHRKRLQGFLDGAEARQARHARLRHLRTGVRGLRGAGGERARCDRRRRQYADVRASTTNAWCWRRARSASCRPAWMWCCPMSTSASSSASRSASSSWCRARSPTCMSR